MAKCLFTCVFSIRRMWMNCESIDIHWHTHGGKNTSVSMKRECRKNEGKKKSTSKIHKRMNFSMEIKCSVCVGVWEGRGQRFDTWRHNSLKSHFRGVYKNERNLSIARFVCSFRFYLLVRLGSFVLFSWKSKWLCLKERKNRISNRNANWMCEKWCSRKSRCTLKKGSVIHLSSV